jgi:hypothetical protein
LGNLVTLFFRQLGGSGLTAFQATTPTKGSSQRVFTSQIDSSRFFNNSGSDLIYVSA